MTKHAPAHTLLFNLRWCLLLLITVVGLRQMQSEQQIAVLLLVVFAAIYHLGLLALPRWAQTQQSTLQIMLDLLVACGGYAFTGAAASSLFGLVIAPALTAYLLRGWRFAAAVLGGAMLGNWLIALFSLRFATIPNTILKDTLLTLLIALLLWGSLVWLQRQAWVQRLVTPTVPPIWQEPAHWAAFSRQMLNASETVATSDTFKLLLEFCLTALNQQRQLGEHYRALLLKCNDAKQFEIALMSGFPDTESAHVFPAEHGALHEVQQMAGSLYHVWVKQDAELRAFLPANTAESAALLPLSVRHEVVAVLVLFGTPIAVEAIPQLEAMRMQVSVALQHAANVLALQQQTERMHHLQEEARRYLARNLHDGPTQQIAAITMKINLIKRKLKQNPDQAVIDLQKLEELARQTTQEVRYLLFTMRPLALETQGLSAAILSLANKMRDNYGLNIRCNLDEDADEVLPPDFQVGLFWIVEQALRNAQKHAAPSQIWLRLSCDDGNVLVRVRDDGVGFDPGRVSHQTSRTNSLGLVNMRERAELMGGTFYIDAAEGKGTTITVLIPQQAIAAARSLWHSPASDAAAGSAFGLPVRGD